MQVTIEGSKSPINLTDKHFVHAGGEGSVYVLGDTAYKVYHDPAKMIEKDRLSELSRIKDGNVIKPEKALYDASGRAIGYTMKAMSNVWALTRLFNKAFRRREGVEDSDVLALVQRMRDTYCSLHEQGFLVADGNELNFFVSNDFKEIYFIDVDAYQTPSFPARAYNEATLDPNLDPAKLRFSQQSDWYAFAIVASQLMLGMHPFKGRYTGTAHRFDKNDISARMKAGVSVFNPEVSVARTAMPIDSLPANYRQWLISVFEHGHRSSAPETMGSLGSSDAIPVRLSSNVLTIKEHASFDSSIIDIYSDGSDIAYKLSDRFVLNGKSIYYKDQGTELLFLPRHSPVFVKRENGSIVAGSVAGGPVCREDFGLREIFVFDNRAYGIAGGHILEFSFKQGVSGIQIMAEVVEDILPETIRCFNGVIIEQLMGGTHATLPIAAGSCSKIHLKDMDGKRILNARHMNGVLVVIWYDQGNYIRSIYRLDRSYRSAVLLTSDVVDTLDINLAVLSQGVAVMLSDAGVIQVFANKVGQDEINEVRDNSIDTDLRLASVGTALYGVLGDVLYRLSLS